MPQACTVYTGGWLQVNMVPGWVLHTSTGKRSCSGCCLGLREKGSWVANRLKVDRGHWQWYVPVRQPGALDQVLQELPSNAIVSTCHSAGQGTAHLQHLQAGSAPGAHSHLPWVQRMQQRPFRLEPTRPLSVLRPCSQQETKQPSRVQVALIPKLRKPANGSRYRNTNCCSVAVRISATLHKPLSVDTSKT